MVSDLNNSLIALSEHNSEASINKSQTGTTTEKKEEYIERLDPILKLKLAVADAYTMLGDRQLLENAQKQDWKEVWRIKNGDYSFKFDMEFKMTEFLPDEEAESGNKENENIANKSVFNSLKIVKKVNKLIKNAV